MTVMKMTVLVAATFAAFGLGADKPIKFADLPPVVQKAMLREAKGTKIKNTLVEVEGGKTYYECETILPNGKTRDFLVNPQGKVTEVEEQAELGELPVAVKAAVEKAAAGGGKITTLESVKKDGKITGYEATVVKNGKKTELELNLDGTPVK